MLKIVSTTFEMQSKLTIDAYIPLDIRWGDDYYTNTSILYWRTGDFKKSLIELGIDSKTGQIRSFTLILVKKLLLISEDLLKSNVPITHGLPVIYTKNWFEKDRFFDEVGEFQCILNESAGRLYIVFTQDQIVKWIKNDRVLFGLNDESMLTIIGVEDFDEKAIRMINRQLI